MANPNPMHKFPKGNTFGGRTPKIKEIQVFCQQQLVELMATLVAIMKSDKTGGHLRVEIAKLLLSYGCGRPSGVIGSPDEMPVNPIYIYLPYNGREPLPESPNPATAGPDKAEENPADSVEDDLKDSPGSEPK